MKAKRRHELQTNELADWLGKEVEKVKPYTAWMLGGLIVLVLGYLYAHWLFHRVSPAIQAVLHIALLAVSLLWLPVIPDPAWEPAGGEEPTIRLLVLLALTVGLPYFLLSTTGPLVQTWYARRHSRELPCRLYAI